VNPKTTALAVFSLTALLIALFFGHPYLLGLPGRIAESRFQSHIRSGMKCADVVRLANVYGGKGPQREDLSPYWHCITDQPLGVEFVDFTTLCISDGKDFTFTFRPDKTLEGWTVADSGSAC